jgi:hypothetical protein
MSREPLFEPPLTEAIRHIAWLAQLGHQAHHHDVGTSWRECRYESCHSSAALVRRLEAPSGSESTLANDKGWRPGRKVGRTLYHDGKLVGLVDTPELAAGICDAMNRHLALGEAVVTMLTSMIKSGEDFTDESRAAAERALGRKP